MALNAKKIILGKENYICPICEKEQIVEIYEENSEALVKNKPIGYREIFYYCPECKEEFFPEKVLDKNLIRVKDAYKKW